MSLNENSENLDYSFPLSGKIKKGRLLIGAISFLSIVLSTCSQIGVAAEYPLPKEADWIEKDFRFHTGEMLPELRMHYTTVGDPKGEPVLILHGTAGSGTGMLTSEFAGELFGDGQPLDAKRHFIILPDAIGAGKSSKPSDGLRMKFPKYDYNDSVEAQYRLVTEALGVRHLRLVLGNSMGGMQTWIWGEKHPGFMDALVPMASQPTAMASRNWMMRRLIIDSIRDDPEWDNGNYIIQPKSAKFASIFYSIAASGGTKAYQNMAPTNQLADKLLDARFAQPFNSDANDLLYQWESSADYDAVPMLGSIEAPLLAINSADDERNPPETGTMERELKKLKSGSLYLIPATEQTRGHSTTANAKFWASVFDRFMQTVPRRSN